MKPILCVIELSDSSEKTLKIASDMAQAGGGHVIVLFVYRLIDRNGTNDIAKLRVATEAMALERFRILEKSVLANRGISYEFQVEIGFTVDRIMSYIRRGVAGSVVISEHQMKNLDDYKSSGFVQFMTESSTPLIIVSADETVTRPVAETNN